MENTAEPKPDGIAPAAETATEKSAPAVDPDIIFVESVRKKLSRGKLLSVIPLLVAAVMIATMYYVIMIFKKLELEAYYQSLTTGMVLGLCMAFIAWAVYTGIIAIIGSRTERLLLKYYDQVSGKTPTASSENSSQANPASQNDQDRPKG